MKSLLQSVVVCSVLAVGFSAKAEVVFQESNNFPERIKQKIVKELEKRCPAIVTVHNPTEANSQVLKEAIGGGYQNFYFAVLLGYNSYSNGGFPFGARGGHFNNEYIQIIVKQDAFSSNENDQDLSIFEVTSSSGVCTYDPDQEQNSTNE